MTKPGERRWLVMTPEIQSALLGALIRQAGGSVSVAISEVLSTADTTWVLEAAQSVDAPDQLLVRLREHRADTSNYSNIRSASLLKSRTGAAFRVLR